MPEPAASHRSRSPEYALLGLLYLQSDHGYNLHRRLIAELGGSWHIRQSQSYTILKRLKREGYLTATPVKQAKLPALQSLKLTPAGRQRFTTWLKTPTGSSVRAIRLEFITRVYFMEKVRPAQVQPMFAEQILAVQATLTRLESSLSALPEAQKYPRLSLQLRIRQLDSTIAWLEVSRREFPGSTELTDAR
jgi:DNA-binding PadR family transcriptional regulator